MDTISSYNSTKRKLKGTSWLFGIAFSFFGLLALIIPIITSVSDYKDFTLQQELFKDGIEITAEITGWTTHYSDDEDSAPSYGFNYTFFNEYKQEWENDKTYQLYSGSTASNFKSSGKIKIKYLENGSSIEMLALSKSRFIKSQLVLIGVAGGFGLIFLGVGMFFIVKEIKKKRLLKGKIPSKEYTVNFGNIVPSSTINGVPYYKVEFSFIDDNGIMVTEKSVDEYSYNEAACYENMRSFRVKTDGKMYMIIDPPRVVAPNNQQYNFDPNQTQQMNNGVNYSQFNNYSQPQNTTNSYNYSNTKYCVYCGAEIDRNDTVCKYCNNPQNTNN